MNGDGTSVGVGTADAALDWFSWLWGGGVGSMAGVVPAMPPGEVVNVCYQLGGAFYAGSRFGSLLDAAGCVGQMDATPGVDSVWARVTSMDPMALGRGPADASRALPALMLDLDLASGVHRPVAGGLGRPETWDDLRRLCKDAGMPDPSAWVHSGGGMYPVWRLGRPARGPFLARAGELLGDLNQRVIEVARESTWRVDNTRDLARVFRVPGSTNRKDPAHPRACRIVERTDVVYGLAELEAVLRGGRQRASGQPAGTLRTPALTLSSPLPLPPDPFGDPEHSYPESVAVAKLAERLERFASLRDGEDFGWNNTLNATAMYFGHFIVPGFMSRTQAETALHEAAESNGMTAWRPGAAGAVAATIRSGLDAGERDWSATILPDPAPARSSAVYDAEGEREAIRGEFSPWRAGNLTDDEAEREAGVWDEELREQRLGGHLGMARRMVERHGRDLKHAVGLGWHVWSGTRWAPDSEMPSPGYARRGVEATLERQHGVANWLAGKAKGLSENPNAQVRGTAEWVEMRRLTDRIDGIRKGIRSQSSPGAIEGILKAARDSESVSINPGRLDKDPYLLNTPSGTIDLGTGMVRPHGRANLLTKISGAGPDPGVAGHAFRAFLERILPDEELRLFVRRLFGSALLGRQRDHVLPVLTGVGGNGKGTLQEVVKAAMGGYAVQLMTDALMEQNYKHAATLIPLRGARIAFTDETADGARIDEPLMKKLTGGGTMAAKALYKDPIEWEMTHTIFLVTNHPPKIDMTEEANRRRVLIIPFDVVIPDVEKDGQLGERLAAELPAVMNWLLEGWRDYAAGGLRVPQSVTDRTAQFAEDMDVFGRWVQDHCELGRAFVESASGLYFSYKNYVIQQGESPISNVLFADELKKRGFSKAPLSAAGKRWVGIQLRPFRGEES